MTQISEKLRRHSDELYGRFSTYDEELSSVNLDDDSWSIREIFGHLVDSALNNYQRFMRLQKCSGLVFPGYELEWIHLASYNSYPLTQLLELWKQANYLLAHIIANLNEECMENIWLRDGEKLSLRFLVTDYVAHLERHIEHLNTRVEELRKATGEKPSGKRSEP